MKRLAPLFALAASAHAQCVMCFRTAEAQNMARAQVLNHGILIMGIPPFLILAGFLLLAWRRSHTFGQSDSARSSHAAEEPREVTKAAVL